MSYETRYPLDREGNRHYCQDETATLGGLRYYIASGVDAGKGSLLYWKCQCPGGPYYYTSSKANLKRMLENESETAKSFFAITKK